MYKSFVIEVIDKLDNLQEEVCTLPDEREMYIVTDMIEITPNTYRQEAYGPTKKLDSASRSSVFSELKDKLKHSRKAGEAVTP